jgi:hypothetical protein
MEAAGTQRKGTAMRRIVVLVSIATAALVGLIVVGARPAAVAEEATPTTMVDHPVIGTWWTANDAPGPGVETAYVVFHTDGTYLEVDPNIGVGVGVWRATGERSAELTYVFQDIDPEPATIAAGTVTVRQSVEVDATGNAFSAPLTVEVRIPDGTVVFSAAYTARGTRLQVEPMLPLGTPPPGTPTS